MADSVGELVVGGRLHHVISCENGTALRELCGGELVGVTPLCKGSADDDASTSTHRGSELRFLSDAHLGRVTKWLRMRGLDIALFEDQDDRTKFIDQVHLYTSSSRYIGLNLEHK